MGGRRRIESPLGHVEVVKDGLHKGIRHDAHLSGGRSILAGQIHTRAQTRFELALYSCSLSAHIFHCSPAAFVEFGPVIRVTHRLLSHGHLETTEALNSH